MKFKVGIDVGGTFTDFLLVDPSGIPQVFKVLSTPEDPSVAVMSGLGEMARSQGLGIGDFLKEVEIIVHGTTVTTNAVLTGNVARTGLLTTRGFRDALQMRRGIREELYNNKYLPPPPIVSRYLRIPVEERVGGKGEVLTPLRLDDIKTGVEIFKENAVEAVAVCYMHAYANSVHEAETEQLLKELLPGAYLSVSSKVLPQIRFYDRVSTTVLNAAVGPILSNYIRNLTAKLGNSGFRGILLIMQSNGGVTTPAVAMDLAASTLLSGPAAAPVAGAAYASVHGTKDFITIDMGGTSFDAALIKDSMPVVTTDGKINRYALALPMMEINTVGAGGGSIGWIDEGGLLRMGPKSAGAKPGPACYGFGGKDPTCTDANLVLGFLNAEYFAGGRMRLDKKAAEVSIKEKIGEPLGLSLIEAAHGMYHIMNVNMASAIREISVQKGYDPRDFLLICAGGAGPIHAAMIAQELAIPSILIPKESSIFCAAGMLLSDLKHDFVRTFHTPFSRGKMDVKHLAELTEEMRKEGNRVLAEENIDEENRRFHFSLDLRYVGQYHEVNVGVSYDDIKSFNEEAVKRAFHGRHDALYGYSLEQEGTEIELVNIRMSAIGLTEKPKFKRDDYKSEDVRECYKGEREVFIPSDREFRVTPVYDGDKMGYGHVLKGPAIIEQVNTTIFVPPGFEVECDAYGSYLLTAS